MDDLYEFFRPFFEIIIETIGLIFSSISELFSLIIEFIQGVLKNINSFIAIGIFETIINLVIMSYDAVRGK